MKRKLAATAATAAIAVAAPATAAKPTQARGGMTAGKARVSRLAQPRRESAEQTLEVMRRDELREHRRKLASKLAAELPRTEPVAVERGLVAAASDPAALGAELASATGVSERQVGDAFEAMARHARQARLRA
jgi:hypothetical protein